MFAFDQQNNNSPNTIINYYNTITDTGQLTSLISGISNDFYNFYNSQTEINNNISNQINSTWSSLHSQINNTYNNLAYQTYILNSSINNIESHLENITNQTAYFKNVYYTNITNLNEGLGEVLNSGTYTQDIGFTYTYVDTERRTTISADTTTFPWFSGFNTSIYPFHDSGSKSGLAWKSDIPTFPDTTDFLLSTAYDDLTEKIDSATSILSTNIISIITGITHDTYTNYTAITKSISSLSTSITQIKSDTSKLSSSITRLSTIINNFSSEVYETILNQYTNLTNVIRNTYTNLTNIINNHTISINTRINNLSSSITDIFESINSINFRLQNNTLTPLATCLTQCPPITTAPTAIHTITDTLQKFIYNVPGGHFWGFPTGGDALAPDWYDLYQWIFLNGFFTDYDHHFEKDVAYNGTIENIINWKNSYWWEVMNYVYDYNERMTLTPLVKRCNTFLTATLAGETFMTEAPFTAKFIAQQKSRITNFVSHHYIYSTYPPFSSTVKTHTCWRCEKSLLVSCPLTTKEDADTYKTYIEYRPYLLNNYFITSLYVINPYNYPIWSTNNFYADMTIDNTKLKQLDVLYDNNFILGWADNWESVCCSGESVYIPLVSFSNLETFRLHIMNDEEFDYRGLHDTFNIIVKQNTNLKYFDFKIGPTFKTMTMSYRIIDSLSGRVKLNNMFPNLETLIFYPNLFYSGLAANQSQTFSVQYEDLIYYIKDFKKLKHIELGLFDDWFRYPSNSTYFEPIEISCSPSYVKIEGYAPHYANWKFPSFSNTNNENITVDLSNFKWRYYHNQQTLIKSTTISGRPPKPEALYQLIPIFKTGTIHILLNANMYKYLSTQINDIINNKWHSSTAGDRTRYKFYFG